MAIKRRDLLKLGGLTLIGTAASAAVGGVYTKPQEALKGSRWALAIDVVKCKENRATCGLKCVEVCHSLHNVPSIPDKKKEIKWIWEEKFEHAFPEHEANHYLNEKLHDTPFLLLCNHCDNPPCVRVCPTKATFKREDGIVMMDYHRCIGCRFCMAACPYGARSFNWIDPRPFIAKVNPEYPSRMKGVVEKCTFCYERIAEGKIPACVEACPAKAIVFGDLKNPNDEINKILKERLAVRRKEELTTYPSVFYLIG
ncbi:MAG: 4Fe-4S ferredoxin iron-sulfur binding domain-containing protein [Thermodesulfobacterium sp. 37_54]|jgi:molybdopterin-containing oxidoreductase family iron-sulfur binding subunit|uniref:4Fe-4S dicluster domain-containing protein n=1 Tax=Thermodesulfobacterium commune TaxID=1741 RepID=A0A101FI51_9BACT|nr:4Fe-4S dicluster domain-containing protein [Thermodesulfobacterium hveragerdense]KUJ98029.1 MAG: 4Fe-4S ferredoxin iron-sulfur binding domain-containing protein [Thermodesulfobacterium sp. 37_54]KUK19308.1 MAG: 4Fe-4S ferredoxin iron-sulfur binding domain-containing protein [Thermodesulfobacterium commune]KUK37458.1 MAG: 4Fe-4S ferredoxin iron-sulfur binding domain-containing protein [Thermodesulfobacterium commune]HAA84061.1 4Fe-4S dicluster domain-containing protein [Thermodesulfobacterium